MRPMVRPSYYFVFIERDRPKNKKEPTNSRNLVSVNMNKPDELQMPPEVAPSIDLNLVEQLRVDPEFRQQFFWAETSAQIASDLIKLRKRRGLSQKELADKTGTKQ